MRPALFVLLLAPTAAWASWPEDVSLTGLTVHDGIRVVDQPTLQDAYDGIVRQLGTIVSNRPFLPAETTGAYGFDFEMSNTFVFVDAIPKDGEDPTIYQRAHSKEDPNTYWYTPTAALRKGLPFSIELGASATWIGNSRTGAFSGYGRVAIVEGLRPWPDLSLQLGYGAYIGNDELEVGTLDFGGTLGTTVPFGSFPGIRQAQFSPFVTVQLLKITAAPLVDEETGEAIFGASWEDVVGKRKGLKPIPQIGGGLQINNSTILLRLSTSWAPKTAPMLHLGMGFAL